MTKSAIIIPQTDVATARLWVEAAKAAGIDVSTFDPRADLPTRLAWARNHDLGVGGVLARQSTKMQHSIADQVRECIDAAVKNRLFVPSEFVFADVQSGRKANRKGLDQLREVLEQRKIQILFVLNLSRLFRSAHRGVAFIEEEVVERGMHAISVAESIDTRLGDGWKLASSVHGLIDAAQLKSMADHVRAGQAGCFLQGFATGALTVGYHTVEAPGAGNNRLGAPRRAIAVNPDVAPRIVQAFEAVRDGLPMYLALRRWNESGGPCDPRATTGRMSSAAFRRMLCNPRYIGRWSFGRRRNRWISKKDSVRQFATPPDQVKHLHREDLRIVTDELFSAVASKLEGLKLRPRGLRSKKQHQLWDLVVDVFHCAHCGDRFYNHGGKGKGMICKNLSECPCSTTLIREEAVRNVCQALVERLQADGPLVAELAVAATKVDAEGDDKLRSEAESVRKRIEALNRKIDDLMELAGEGSPEDRAAMKARIRNAQAELAPLREQSTYLESRRKRAASPVTPAEVLACLNGLEQHLVDAAAGKLGADMIHLAATAFRLLVGGRIDVYVEKRANRKWTQVYGAFRPQLLQALPEALGGGSGAAAADASEVRAWLRRRSSREVLGPRVYELMDVQGLSYRATAKVLQEEGHNVGSGVVWQCRFRQYEILGLPFPTKWKRPKKTPRSDDS